MLYASHTREVMAWRSKIYSIREKGVRAGHWRGVLAVDDIQKFALLLCAAHRALRWPTLSARVAAATTSHQVKVDPLLAAGGSAGTPCAREGGGDGEREVGEKAPGESRRSYTSQ